MRKNLIALLLVLALPLGLSAGIMSVEELKKEIKSNKNLVMIGIDMKDKYIAGSQVTEYRQVKTRNDEVPAPRAFEAMMQKLGVNSNSKVVIYERGEGAATFYPAVRLYWTFKFYGYDNVHFLEGGLIAWEDIGGEVAKGKPTRGKKGNFKTKEPRMEFFASMDDVKAAIGKKTIIDMRPILNYLGVVKPGTATQEGHINTAKTTPIGDFLKNGTHLYTKEQYEGHIRALNIDLDGDVISYCNVGSMGTVGWFFIHEILGKKARVYIGSMKEWNGEVSNILQN